MHSIGAAACVNFVHLPISLRQVHAVKVVQSLALLHQIITRVRKQHGDAMRNAACSWC